MHDLADVGPLIEPDRLSNLGDTVYLYKGAPVPDGVTEALVRGRVAEALATRGVLVWTSDGRMQTCPSTR